MKVGDIVHYHSVIGGPITSSGHVIEAFESDHVAWISGKRGCVAVRALSLEKEGEPMKMTYIFKAQKIAGKDKDIKSQMIVLENPLPEEPQMSFDEHRDRFAAEAIKLADVLCMTLPGGTLDALLGILMQRKASLFVVPLYDGKAKP